MLQLCPCVIWQGAVIESCIEGDLGITSEFLHIASYALKQILNYIIAFTTLQKFLTYEVLQKLTKL